MAWGQYSVEVSLRSGVPTRGKRHTAKRRVTVYANSHEEAITKARERTVRAFKFSVHQEYSGV